MIEMTLNEVKQNPQMFMYIFVDANFAKQLGKYYKPVMTKRANQIKVLQLSAMKYGLTYADYQQAIKQAFTEAFGVTPNNALKILASGGTVAGKNWAAGVYGVGAIAFQEGFKNSGNVTVEGATGKILKNGVEQPGQTVVYSEKCPNNVQGYSCVIDGVTYTSQYYRVRKKYGAGMYETSAGKFKANGVAATTADLSNIWEGVELLFSKFVDWLISLFGGTKNDEGELISPENTIPSQTKDGFVSEGGWNILQGNTGLVLLALGAGTLLMTGNLPGFKGKKGKKNRK